MEEFNQWHRGLQGRLGAKNTLNVFQMRFEFNALFFRLLFMTCYAVYCLVYKNLQFNINHKNIVSVFQIGIEFNAVQLFN